MPTGDKKLIQDWSLKVQRGEAFRKKIYTDHQWRRFEGYFRNKYPGLKDNYGSLDRNQGSMTIQRDAILAREARKSIPRVIFGIPYINIKPLAGRLPIHAKVLERVINGILETILINQELSLGVLSAYQHGTSFIKLGYDSLYVPSYKEVLTQGYSTGAFDKKGKRLEFKDTVYPGLPWATWQHPRNVILPEMIDTFSNARWIGFKYFRTVEDAQKDKRLSNTKDLKPVGYRFEELDPLFSAELPRYPTVTDMALFTEIRDKETGMMYIFSEDHDKILYKGRDALMDSLGGRLPCHQIIFNQNTDWAYGTSDVETVEPELKELMDLRTQHVKIRRRQVGGLAVQKGRISPAEKARLVSGDVGAVVEIEGNLENAMKEIKFSKGNEFMAEEQDLERRIRQQFAGSASGVHPSSRRNKEEIGGAQQDALVDTNQRQAVIRQMVVEIAKDIANMVFSFWSEETVVDILAPITQHMPDPNTGQLVPQDVTKQVWVKFKGKELIGNFDYSINPTSGRFQDQAQSKREAFEIIKFFSQIPGINMPELVRQLADRFDGLDVDKLFLPLNQPGEALGLGQAQGLIGQNQGRGLSGNISNQLEGG